MKFVLDASVGLKWFLSEIDTTAALSVRERYIEGNLQLLAPDIFPIEMVHALTKAERQGRIQPAEGRRHFQDLFGLLPILYPYLPLLSRAYVISTAARIGVYDCLYVALAEREGLSIADGRRPVQESSTGWADHAFECDALILFGRAISSG